MRRIDGKTIITQATTAQTFYSTTETLDNVYGISAHVKYTDATPAAFNFATTDVAIDPTNIITHAAHTMVTGLKVRLTTSNTLPAGLSAGVDYFVIKKTANTFQLASSLVNANAGTAVAITDVGTGTHTVTATAISGTITPQMSNDVDNLGWVDDTANAVNLSSAGANFLTKPTYQCRSWRLKVAITAGQISSSAVVNAETDGIN